MAEDEMFKVMKSGKRQKKQWKRMVTKPTFVGTGFTRKPPKYERFIRPTGIPPHPTPILTPSVDQNLTAKTA
jgi:ribosome biogenesis protein NSA2